MKVSVIIPHYSEDKTYLHLCINSLLRQTYSNLEIIVSSSSSITPTGLHPKVRLYQSQTRMHYAQAINKGVSLALDTHTGDVPKYLVLGNDDTIYSEEAIQGLVDVAADNDVVLNGFSNCDNGFLHFSAMMLTNGDKQLPLKAQVELSEAEGFFDRIMSIKNGMFGPRLFIPSPGPYTRRFVCFYATLIPTRVWLKVGTIDEQFVTAGKEDADYCYRAIEKGVAVGWSPYPFIFHFGGKTSNLVTTQEERDSNDEKFLKKWNMRIN